MEIKSGISAVLSLMTMGLGSAPNGQTATAGVTAKVTRPSQLDNVATSLLSSSPGVFTLRIPGGTQAPTITVTAQASNRTNGAINFLTSNEGVEALRDLILQIQSSPAPSAGSSYQLSSTAADGAMGGQGVQMTILSSPSGDGGDVIRAIITFD